MASSTKIGEYVVVCNADGLHALATVEIHHPKIGTPRGFVSIPAKVLVEWVAFQVASARIAELEQADALDVLGVRRA